MLAKKVCAVIRDSLEPFASGQIGRYDDSFEVRAFGDNILGFAPALTFTEDEFAQMFVRLKKTLDEVLDAADVRAALAG